MGIKQYDIGSQLSFCVRDKHKYISELRGFIMNYFRICLIFIALHFISLSTPAFYICTPALSAELTFTSSVGYNANPALESATDRVGAIKGSPFSTHTLALEESFNLTDKFTIDFLPSVSYQNLWEVPDNHQFNIDLSISPVSSWERVMPYIFITSYLYRDSLLKPDERDEFTLGAGAEIVLSSRYTLAFEHGWQWISYLEDAPLFFHAGRNIQQDATDSGIDNPLSGISIPNDPLEQTYNARDDVNMLLKTRLDIFILPSLNASLGLKYEYLASSLDAESFWQLTPDVKVVWAFATQWQLVVATQLERRKYFDIHEAFPEYLDKSLNSVPNTSESSGPPINNETLNIRDVNYTTALNLRLAYCWKRVELFTDFFIEHGEYPLNNESYNQQVVQCGFSWSF